jgi:histidyl-tRNA synthetase
VECLVVPLSPLEADAARALVWSLRNAGIRADLPYAERSLKTHLKHANRIGARTVALIGAVEREAGTCTLRNMTSGEQEHVALDQAAARIREVTRSG